MQRSAMREMAFKFIYGLEVQKSVNELEQLDVFIEDNEITDEKVIEYLKDIQNGLIENSQEINSLIEKNLKEKWTLDRVSKINLSLLKIAIFEMLYKDLPYKVAINEVVELAKKYSDEQSPVFINGILASVVKEKNLSEKDN